MLRIDRYPASTEPLMPRNPASQKSPVAPASEAEVAAAGLDRLRSFRVRPPRETGIGRMVAGIQREARRHQSGTGSFVEAWEQVIPEALRKGSRVRGLRGGVARVQIADAAARYELDALLRSGVLADLRLAFGKPLRRVQLEIIGRD